MSVTGVGIGHLDQELLTNLHPGHPRPPMVPFRRACPVWVDTHPSRSARARRTQAQQSRGDQLVERVCEITGDRAARVDIVTTVTTQLDHGAVVRAVQRMPF
ncbi:MAG: hypothetical protein ACRDUV_13350, partial [Pseudonocardiaceae bacterium]